MFAGRHLDRSHGGGARRRALCWLHGSVGCRVVPARWQRAMGYSVAVKKPDSTPLKSIRVSDNLECNNCLF